MLLPERYLKFEKKHLKELDNLFYMFRDNGDDEEREEVRLVILEARKVLMNVFIKKFATKKEKERFDIIAARD